MTIRIAPDPSGRGRPGGAERAPGIDSLGSIIRVGRDPGPSAGRDFDPPRGALP